MVEIDDLKRANGGAATPFYSMQLETDGLQKLTAGDSEMDKAKAFQDAKMFKRSHNTALRKRAARPAARARDSPVALFGCDVFDVFLVWSMDVNFSSRLYARSKPTKKSQRQHSGNRMDERRQFPSVLRPHPLLCSLFSLCVFVQRGSVGCFESKQARVSSCESHRGRTVGGSIFWRHRSVVLPAERLRTIRIGEWIAESDGIAVTDGRASGHVNIRTTPSVCNRIGSSSSIQPQHAAPQSPRRKSADIFA